MMQNHTGHVSMDSEFQALRINLQDQILKRLERTPSINSSSEWKQRLPDIAKRIEEAVFKESLNKDDYVSKFQSGIVKYVLNEIRQNQQWQCPHQLHQQQQQTMVHHNIQSNSSVSGMMMPTPPGIFHNPTGTMRMPSLMESNQGINPISVPAGIPMSNGYQLSHGNMSIDQPGSTSMSASIGVRHQVTPQMIQTPGFNSTSITQVTQQTMPMNNGSGTQPQRQQQYNTLSGQVRPGMQLVPMNQKHSSQAFGDGMINNNNRLGLLGNNIQQRVSEGNMGIGGTYGDLTKPLQQGFSSQQIQQRMPTSLSQQRVSLMGNNTVAKQVDMTMSSSGSYYNPAGPSNLSSASNLNNISAVAASLPSKRRPMMKRGGNQLHQQYQQQQQQPMMTRGGNQLHQQSMQQQQQQPMMMGGNQLHQQSMQQHHQRQQQHPTMTRTGNQLHQQSMQQQQQPMMTRGGNQLHQQSMQQQLMVMMDGNQLHQQSMQQHHQQQQHQQSMQQQPMMTGAGNQLHQQCMQQQQQQQPMMTRGGNQLHQQSMQQQPMMTRGGNKTFSRQSSFGSINTDQVMAESALLTDNHLMLPQHADFQVPFGNNKGGQGQFFAPLAGCSASKQTVQSGELSSLNGVVNSRSRVGIHQPDSMLVQQQSQRRPTQLMQQVQQQMQRNNHQMVLDQPCMTISSEGVQAPGPSVTTMVVPDKGPPQSQPTQQEIQHLNQMKLILYLFHARYCRAPVGHCPEEGCVKAQHLIKHIDRCKKKCEVHLCLKARTALLHFRYCREVNCLVCSPARNFLIMAKHKSSLTLKSGCGSEKGLNGKEVDKNKMETAAPVALPASAPLAMKHSQKGMNQLDSSSGLVSVQMDVEPLSKRRRIDMDISHVSVNNTGPSFSALQEEAFRIEQQSTSNIPAKQVTDVTIDPAFQNLQITSTVADMSSVQMVYGLDGDVSMIRSSQTDVGPTSPSLLVKNKERNDENKSEAQQEDMEEDGAADSSLLVENEERNDANATEAKQEEMEVDGAAGPSLLVEYEERNDENATEAQQVEMEEDGVAGPSLLVENEERNDENATEAKQEEMVVDGSAGPSLLVEKEDRNDENVTEAQQEEMEEDGAAGPSLLDENEERSDENATEAKQEEIEVYGAAGPSLLVENEERNDENATEAQQEEMEEDGASCPSLLIENEKKNDENATEAKLQEMEEDGAASKSGKPKTNGVSMMELFMPEQVREHVKSLRQWVGQSKSMAEKNQAISMNENSCQLCAVEKLTFEPPPIYCTPCDDRIKRNAMYYTICINGQRHYICNSCFNATRGTINIEGQDVPKRNVEKKRNDEETEEAWVQCDKCEAWQHQICALFNGRRNDGGQAEYTCPNCYIQEVETGERKPLPQSAMLGAKDLPRTILSDHIENRLFERLKQERQDRANHFGKSFDEVPGAEELVVRVVSTIDKKLEVKPRFLEVFQEENYPTEFPYKSKAILLFQKIEGVEVCIFGMYVQEFGMECGFPNQRRVYLSYLDSIKYFRPEIRTVSGEALRTFVYHEILIGYLEYVKRRGFTSCYIWACPPQKGEDYILYCHPEIQKTPKSDKLVEWYLSMLKKAVKENIVVDITNMYDHFFTNQRESRAKVTAARLPYFDGDYWPGAAEVMITQLRQGKDDRKQHKKGNMKTKHALKAVGHTDLSSNASKDAMLMHKLGEKLFPIRKGLIMVHLQHPCNHCCILMVSGTRWVCNSCRDFNLCDSCHNAEKLREHKERHPTHSREKHTFRQLKISGVPNDTKDNDDILESEFFDTRQAFLSLCQGNHYQYDTLRSAKYSSMMLLYHLHNPTAPAYVTTCNICSNENQVGQGWRCEVCPDFDVCNSCYQKEGVVNHPHKLTKHPSNAERDVQNKEARQKRVLQLRKMLELLGHASECQSLQCQYPNCRKLKGLFHHGVNCKVRVSKGCRLCKHIWYLLQLHARACKETACNVPRCKDLKEQMQRVQKQSESRRRAAVNEMTRQCATEVSENNDI
ncbi:putative histone acetyltransferase HAC-like 1 [Carex rostrata]